MRNIPELCYLEHDKHFEKEISKYVHVFKAEVALFLLNWTTNILLYISNSNIEKGIVYYKSLSDIN